MIASPLFTRRLKLPNRVLGQWLVRSAGTAIDDALFRFGWEGGEPAITTVITADIASGAVRGSRFETRGGIDPVDDDELEITFKKRDGSILATEADREAAQVGNLCVRFTVLPGAVDTFYLYAGIVPFARDELQAKLQEKGLDLSSPLCSTIPLRLFNSRGKWANARPVKLLLQEQGRDGFCFGHLPLLELIGPGQRVFPDHDAIEQEMVALLRAVALTNNVASARLAALYTTEGFPSVPTGKISFEWPECRGPAGAPGAAGSGPRRGRRFGFIFTYFLY